MFRLKVQYRAVDAVVLRSSDGERFAFVGDGVLDVGGAVMSGWAHMLDWVGDSPAAESGALGPAGVADAESVVPVGLVDVGPVGNDSPELAVLSRLADVVGGDVVAELIETVEAELADAANEEPGKVKIADVMAELKGPASLLAALKMPKRRSVDKGDAPVADAPVADAPVADVETLVEPAGESATVVELGA